MVFEPGDRERRLAFAEFNRLAANLQMRVSTLQGVAELFEQATRIEPTVAGLRPCKRDTVSKHHADTRQRVIALMCLACFGQPSKGSFIRAAISHAVEFLRSQDSQGVLHLGIGSRLSFNVAVVSRIKFEQFWSVRGGHAAGRAAAVHNIEGPSGILWWD